MFNMTKYAKAYMVVTNSPGITPYGLSKLAGITPRTARQYLDALCADGLVEVQRHIAPNGTITRIYTRA